MTELPDLSQLTHDEKDALIRALWAQVQALTVRGAELEARLGAPPKTPDNSSLPPSRGSMQSCGVVASGRQLRHQFTPVRRARNPLDHASTPQLCMLPS